MVNGELSIIQGIYLIQFITNTTKCPFEVNVFSHILYLAGLNLALPDIHLPNW
jgi:hypothetical protein